MTDDRIFGYELTDVFVAMIGDSVDAIALSKVNDGFGRLELNSCVSAIETDLRIIHRICKNNVNYAQYIADAH